MSPTKTELANSQNGNSTKVAPGAPITFDARFLGQREPADEDTLKIDVRLDGKYIKVVVAKASVSPESWSIVQTLGEESIIRVSGSIVELDTDPSSMTIVNAASINVISPAAAETSRLLANAELEERLNHRILDVRRAASGAIFKLHSGMYQLIVEYLCSHGFHWIHTPRLITATIDGDNEYFKLPYFGKDVYLAQSSQHHKQMALSMDMKRVFEIGPVFRAEKKSGGSARHMTEFTVLDIAMAFDDEYREVVDLIEDMLVFVLKGLQERPYCKKLVEAVQQLYPDARPFRIALGQDGRIPRISFLEAKRILREDLDRPSDDSKNFTDEEEAALGEHFRSVHSTDIFTVESYPASMRQFNSAPHPLNPKLSNTWDTLVGGREICSGSQRIHSYAELRSAMQAGTCGPPLDPDAPQWQPYLEAFRLGMPKHGGCGLGVNRLLQGFLGLKDVREVTLFPRDVNRVTP